MKKKFFVTILTFSFFLSVTGAQDPLKEGIQLSIYPNPASNQLNVKIDLEYLSATLLTIIDVTGKTVKDVSSKLTHKNGMYHSQLDVGDLKAGIYFVQLTQQKKAYSKKLVIR